MSGLLILVTTASPNFTRQVSWATPCILGMRFRRRMEGGGERLHICHFPEALSRLQGGNIIQYLDGCA